MKRRAFTILKRFDGYYLALGNGAGPNPGCYGHGKTKGAAVRNALKAFREERDEHQEKADKADKTFRAIVRQAVKMGVSTYVPRPGK